MQIRDLLLATSLASASILAVPVMHAEVKLPAILADHMVIQRDMPVHLWGTAAPGEKVHAEFRGHKADITADASGNWSITLPKGSAGGPFPLLIQGANKISFKDILVGDVWIASGQSNMEYTMDRDTSSKTGVQKTSVKDANYPDLRLFHVTDNTAPVPQTDMLALQSWTPTTPDSVFKFSAIAYYFGREILTDQKIPIGLIDSSVGATSAETWSTPETMADTSLIVDLPRLKPRKGDERRIKQGKPALGHDAANVADIDPDELTSAADIGLPSRAYNAMIAPLTYLPIKGVIWYQGNNNALTDARSKAYQRLFPALITGWRKQWHEGDFPFLYVQLTGREANYDLAGVRQAQLMTLSLPNTGMAVSADIGDPKLFHPPNKPDIGHRLALIADAQVYGDKIEYYGPLFAKAVPNGHSITVSFTHTTGGLVVKGGKLAGFEVAGADGKWAPADAAVDGLTVVASSAAVSAPLYVRYAYYAYGPTPLYNGVALPASPFTSKPD